MLTDEVKKRIRDFIQSSEGWSIAMSRYTTDYTNEEEMIDGLISELIPVITEMVEGELSLESILTKLLKNLEGYEFVFKEYKRGYYGGETKQELALLLQIKELTEQYLLEKKGNDRKFYYPVEGSEKAV